jgi:hypothetical protein
VIRLRFISENNLMSPVVCWWTGCEFSHVEVCLPEGYLGARPFAEHIDGKTIPPGVQIRPFNYLTPKKEAFATIDVDDDVTSRVINVLREQIGKEYDLRAILGFPFNRDWRETNAFICSELCAYAFEQVGRPLLNPVAKVSRLSPRDILLSPYIKSDRFNL